MNVFTVNHTNIEDVLNHVSEGEPFDQYELNTHAEEHIYACPLQLKKVCSECLHNIDEEDKPHRYYSVLDAFVHVSCDKNREHNANKHKNIIDFE